jgi:hypothetical protein
MSFTLDPQVAEALAPVAAARAGGTPAEDVADGLSANSRQPSAVFFGGRRLQG